MTTANRKNIRTILFQRAIRDARWADAAAMVRERLTRPEPVTGAGDRIADWLAEGTFSGAETAASVAREWENI